ncbi:MAG: hypothetical protein QOD24_1893 [Solirubrobacteraceae bacterium]|nr:hypothetical protein [Solirubrobacteraceae bacterium]
MTKTWVLDTETKGTGANMVPLEKRRPKPDQSREALYVPRKHTPPPPKPPAPKPARRFKVIDVVSRQVLTEGTGTRDTVDVLQNVRSIVDIQVYVWQPVRETWRMLGFDEVRLLWDQRGS